MSSLTLTYEADGTGAVSRPLESWLGDAPLTPLDFGAVGDGSTDDTAALQLWLDALVDGGAGVVPHGKTFGYTSEIYIKSGTRLVAGTGGVLKALDDASLVVGHDVTDLRIEGLIIDQNDMAGQGLRGENNQRLSIVGCRILNCSDACGILLRAEAAWTQDVSDILIADNYVDCVGAGENQFGIWVTAELEGDANDTWQNEGAGNQGSAVGTLVTSTWKARNVRILGNEVVGGYYQICGFFLEDFVIADNLCRDLGDAVDGGVRGITLEYSCKRGTVTGNRIRNTQSSSIHISYGCEDLTVCGNNITNTVTSLGTGGVNGSQALIQVQVGCTNITITDNDIVAPGGTNGAEFMVNIGPHSHRTRIVDNRFYGKVAKAGINVESTYDSSAMRATSYAYDPAYDPPSYVGFDPAKWATTALSDVEIVGNTIHLTNTKAGIQIIQAASISISGLVLRDNMPKGSATGNSIIVSSGSVGYGHGAMLEGSASLDLSSIPGASFGTATVTVAGAATSDALLGWGTSAALPTGVFILGATITAANTVVITLFNTTGGSLDPASMTYRAYVEKKLL